MDDRCRHPPCATSVVGVPAAGVCHAVTAWHESVRTRGRGAVTSASDADQPLSSSRIPGYEVDAFDHVVPQPDEAESAETDPWFSQRPTAPVCNCSGLCLSHHAEDRWPGPVGPRTAGRRRPADGVPARASATATRSRRRGRRSPRTPRASAGPVDRPGACRSHRQRRCRWGMPRADCPCSGPGGRPARPLPRGSRSHCGGGCDRRDEVGPP